MHGIPTASVYGLSSAVICFVWAAAQRRNPIPGRVLYLVLIVTLVTLALPPLVELEAQLVPWKYDRLLFALDGSLGLSVLALSRATPDWLYVVFALIYKSLPWAMTAWAAVHISRPWGQYREMMRAFAFAYLICGPLYLIVPACGTACSIKYFDGGLGPLVIPDTPNTIPSMHFASALLLWVFAGPRRVWRVALSLYLFGIAVSTVLAGEHYFIDWAPAVPLVTGAVAAARRDWRHAAVWLSVVVAWLFVIRFAGPWFVDHPGAMWVPVVATVWGMMGHERPTRQNSPCRYAGLTSVWRTNQDASSTLE